MRTQLEEVVLLAKKLLTVAARTGQLSAANGALANILHSLPDLPKLWIAA